MVTSRSIQILQCLAVTAALAAGIARAAGGVDGRPEVRVTIEKGEQYQLCQDLAAEYRRLRVHNTPGRHCGVPIPMNDPDYRLVKWTDIDPVEHMDLISVMYYWTNLGVGVGREGYSRQSRDRSRIDPELFGFYWPKAEQRVAALVNSGKVILQTSQVDIDFDGETEVVYRLSPIIRLGSARPPQSETTHSIDVFSSCRGVGLQGSTRDYVYYTPTADVPDPKRAPFIRSQLEMGDLFLWRGRVYWASWEGNVFEPNAEGRVVHVCNVDSRIQEEAMR